MFQLSKDEWKEVITNCDNLPENIKFSPATPFAFTEQGVAMLVFTATHQLRQLLTHNGVRLTVLAEADPALLAPSPNEWGRYYDSRPQVVAFSLEETFALFAKNKTLSEITDSFSLAFPAFSRTLGATL